MLPKELRLPRELFPIIKKSGRIFHGAFVSIIVKPNSTNSSRFGIVVSKKVSLKAVDRNAVKRLVRRVIVANKGNLKGPNDVAILTKSGIVGKSEGEISADLLNVFTKSKLI